MDSNQYAAIQGSIPTSSASAAKQWIEQNHIGRCVSYSYDVFNRLTKTRLPDDATVHQNTDNPCTEAFYDLSGRKWLEIDADRKATAYVYDALGRFIWVVTDVYVSPAPPASLPSPLPTNISGWQAWAKGSRSASDSTATEYRYDYVGNLTKQIDANNHETAFEYDQLGRRISRTLPGTQVERWVYDCDEETRAQVPLATTPKPNKVLHKDFFSTPRQVLTIHDTMGRVEAKKKPEGALWTMLREYDYAPAGQRQKMRDNLDGTARETRYAYDEQGRLKVKQSPEGTLSYGYDPAGNVTEISARNVYNFPTERPWLFLSGNQIVNSRPSGVYLGYHYDGRNRLWKVYADPGQATLRATYGYDAAGNLGSVAYANGITTTYAYNARQHLRRARAAAGASLIANFDYDEAGDAAAPAHARGTWTSALLSPSGRRNRMLEKVGGNVRTVNYTYDNLNRLGREDIGGSSLVYDTGAGYEASGYDPVGNRRSRVVSGTGFPGVAGQTGLAYDKNDRTDNDADANTPSTLFDANGNRTTYGAWTYSYDLEDRLIGATDGSKTITVVYDGDGNRVLKTVAASGITTTTAYLIDDRNPTGYSQVIEERIGQSANPSATYAYGLDLISQTRSGTTSYYGYDGQGSVRFLMPDSSETSLVSTVTPNTLRNNHTGWVGLRMKVGSTPLCVSALGRWVVSGNSRAHTVKLVNENGTDVPGGAVSVNTAGATAGQFAYAALAQPVWLSADTVYYLVSEETYGGDYWYDYTTVVTPSSGATIP